jgi:hypothetical protein
MLSDLELRWENADLFCSCEVMFPVNGCFDTISRNDYIFYGRSWIEACFGSILILYHNSDPREWLTLVSGAPGS